MALNQKQKDIRDKKVAELEDKISAKNDIIQKTTARQGEEIQKHQDELDEIIILRDALKALK